MGRFVDEFCDGGERFWRCKACKRVGKFGWTHVHYPGGGSNWYASVAELRAKLAASTIPPGTIIRGRRA